VRQDISGPEEWSQPPIFPSGSAGLVSTVDDCLRFGRLLLHGGTHEGRRVLKVIRESSQEMGRLIDDLLAFSHLGRREIQGQDTDMNKLAREVVEELCGDLQQKNPPEVEVRSLPNVRCDRSLVRQVWVNLVSNAIKFSAKAQRPRIEIGAYPSPEAGASVLEVCTRGRTAAGRDYTNWLVAIFEFRGGKIVLLRESINPLPVR
jgi:signal transduction histidine kinase